jgi:hypothetical protein
MTLFQRVGRAPWVILGEVADGDDRFAEVKVIEVLKGAYARPSLRVVYKMESFTRKSWEEKIEFAAGDRVVLFLKRYESDREDGKVPEELKAEDVFAPAFGAQGKFTVPEEGAPAYLEALRVYVKVSGLPDPVAQEEALLGFLVSPNPHVLQTGVEQVLERRLAGEAQAETLMGLTGSPRDPVRLTALQILRQVAEDLRAAKRTLPAQADVVSRLKGIVLGEGSEVFRAEAVRTIAAFAVEAERAFFERLSKDDRSQLVRYEASRALVESGRK